MAIIKCKMCGGDMELSPDKSFGTCEYCGSTMTLPKVDDEQRAAAFNRGNHFRRLGEFDKALTVYERIVQEDEQDAEAHWCCALCRFGIEYVKDPATGEYLPTCHRASFDSFLEDVDYQAALKYADAVARRQYEKDGEVIAKVQRGILSVSQKEKPFDVFLCYKESDENGNRTVDSTLAQDIYYQLTDRGYRVFFARITLEDKAGQAYEPYIFAALHSAKVMIVVGTRPEYLNAVWVKNEWSRYLSIVKNDRTKLLIPCYRDMDPYDMPEQLSVLQSYDMGKIGFMQDLIRGISKVIEKESPKPEYREEYTTANEVNSNLTALLKRGFMALEDQEWERADEFFEQALNQDAECGEAYFGKYLADQKCSTMESWVKHTVETELEEEEIHVCTEEMDELTQLAEQYRVQDYLPYQEIVSYVERFDDKYQSVVSALEKYIDREKEMLSIQSKNKQLGRAFRYAVGEFGEQLTAARIRILKGLEQKLQSTRQSDQQEEQRIREAFEAHKTQVLLSLKELNQEALKKKEADEQAAEKERQAAEEKRETAYQAAIKLQQAKKYKEAHDEFERLRKYRDSQYRSYECLKSDEKRMKRRVVAVIGLIVLVIVSVIAYRTIIIPGTQYREAEALLKEGNYESAAETFTKLGKYRDAADRVLETQYIKAKTLLEQQDYYGAATAFAQAIGYEDAREQSMALWERMAVRSTMSAGDYHAVGLKTAGTVVATGDNEDGQCDVSDWADNWADIIAVSAGNSHTVGLKADGTVVATGNDWDNQCDVAWWTDIVAVSAGNSHTVGLKADGTVVATGNDWDNQCNVVWWTDIVAVSAGNSHTVGLKVDGTVVAVGSNEYDQRDVSVWTDIVAVSAGDYHTVGVKTDGTVVATGWNHKGQCDVSEWTDIVAVSAGNYHTVGVKTDGTVVATGKNEDGQCNVSDWTDIIAVSAGDSHTVGLKSDGTVVATGNNEYGQCDVSGWTNIRIPAKTEMQ